MAVFVIIFGIVFFGVFAFAITRIIKAVGSGVFSGQGAQNNLLDMQHEQAMRMHTEAHNQAVRMHIQAHNTAMNVHNQMFHM